MGTRFRVTEGLSGRCFMAFLPEAECDSLLKSVGLTPFAGLPAPTVRAYRAQLSAAREAGYVALTESPISGANGVAAPVFDSEGRILFAGEHASLAHTWMQGALESAVTAVRAMLAGPE